MNEAAFRAEQMRALQAARAGAIDPNAVITGMRLEDGSYHVLSRCGDNTWILPDSLFPAGTEDSRKKLNFTRVPSVFRETLRACTMSFMLAGIEGRRRPKGGTIYHFFTTTVLFLDWLTGLQVGRLRDMTPLIGQQYVQFCQSQKGIKGAFLSDNALKQRFNAIELLHILSQQSEDPMRHPWPESSSAHLAGLTGQNARQEARTEVIPDDVLGPLFRSARNWLDRADEIVDLRAQVDFCRSEGRWWGYIDLRLKSLGWTQKDLRSAEQHLQTACMCIILITGGIRISELLSLENQCAFTTLDEEGEPFHWLRGISYKTGAGACEWLVADVAHRAVAVAKRLAYPLQARLAQRINELRAKNPREPDIARLRGHADRLFLAANMKQKNRIGTLTSHSFLSRLKAFSTQCELDWHFAPHQFRRTFAVYAAHSAFGDLRYLRDHFKHWSLDMTALYAMNRKQDAELYDSVGMAALNIKTDLLEHWLEPDAILAGGAAEPIRAFSTKRAALNTKNDRAEMAKTISPLVHLRATGVAWCTADTGGCNGGHGAERTRCGNCSNAVIDEGCKPVWQAIYAQQLELRAITDIGPGGKERIERDIKRCEKVLGDLGVTVEV